MDCKAMISARRREATYLRESRGQHTLATEFEEDADAIETLMTERDALLSEIKGDCCFCAFETGACVACDNGESWQWRGPQKEGG